MIDGMVVLIRRGLYPHQLGSNFEVILELHIM